MDYKPRITIDLARFGQTGPIELGAPTFRQRIDNGEQSPLEPSQGAVTAPSD